MNLLAIIMLLNGAVCPEDVFGVNGEPLGVKFKKLAKQAHPDLFQGREKAKAEEAFKKLNEWYGKAEAKVAAGTDGDRTGDLPVIHTKTETYKVTQRLATGDISDVLVATKRDGRSVVLKAVRNAVNNDLMAVEAKTLAHMVKESPPALCVHLPHLVDSFELRDAKQKKRVNVTRWEPGGFTLTRVLQSYSEGLALQVAAWMWRRMLGSLIAAHAAGVVHGAVVPEHFVVYPDTHNGVLVDWCYAVNSGGTIKAIASGRKGYYPPEVFRKEPATAGTDIYMAAKCMLFLLGGNPETGSFNKTMLPPRVVGLLRSCWLPPRHRTSDAFELFEEFGAILQGLYGPPKFRPFAVPDLALDKK